MELLYNEQLATKLRKPFNSISKLYYFSTEVCPGSWPILFSVFKWFCTDKLLNVQKKCLSILSNRSFVKINIGINSLFQDTLILNYSCEAASEVSSLIPHPEVNMFFLINCSKLLKVT